MGKKSRAEATASLGPHGRRRGEPLDVEGVERSGKWAHERERKPLLPANDNQDAYLDALRHSTQTVVTGPAGTGKTFLAACSAADDLLAGKAQQIILIRPNVSAGQKLGFLPGTEEEKLEAWLRPLLNALRKRLGDSMFDYARRAGKIVLMSVETMRGDTFENARVIVDEAQNLTTHELKMILTRIGRNCRIVVNGDIDQSDLKIESGLYQILRLIREYDLDVSVIAFTIDDVVRSGPCAEWVKAFHRARL